MQREAATASQPVIVQASPGRGGRAALIVATAAATLAAVFAWRLYSPPWLGGVEKPQPQRPPPSERVAVAPGPDNTATTLPPLPPQPVSPPPRSDPPREAPRKPQKEPRA